MDSSVLRQLRKIAGPEAVLDRPEDLMLYEYDAGVDKSRPGAVVFPQNTEQVSRVLRLAHEKKVPVVPRGAGTGLSGGAIARKEAIVLSLSRMNRILEIDIPNQRAVVQPGVVNLELSNATAPFGFYYAPDPSSQKACTIGGNVAENSGGPHTLALGVTVNHVTGVEVVLVSEMERMKEAVEEKAEAVTLGCMGQKAREVRGAKSEQERQLLWLGRKTAFGAIGRITSSYYTQDGVIPRTKIPATLAEIARIGEKYSLKIGNVFHAGDGNLHPLILFDGRDPRGRETSRLAARDIMSYCMSVGGSITGEHGVGMEKMNLMPLM